MRSPRALNLDRPTRLRRIAELVESQAEKASSPARARAIARRMRVRATELECADRDEFEAAGSDIKALISQT